MKIEEVSCMAVKNDGTLLIKANVDGADDSYRYAFYIYKGSDTVYKSAYDRKSFIMYKVDTYGKYQIKAFVRNADGSEKDSMVIPYVVNKSNARDLAEDDIVQIVPIITTSVQVVNGNTVLVSASGELSEDMQFAWYVYKGDEKEPVYKSNYSANPLISYMVKEKGNYFAKLFVKNGGQKCTYKTETFSV